MVNLILREYGKIKDIKTWKALVKQKNKFHLYKTGFDFFTSRKVDVKIRQEIAPNPKKKGRLLFNIQLDSGARNL